MAKDAVQFAIELEKEEDGRWSVRFLTFPESWPMAETAMKRSLAPRP